MKVFLVGGAVRDAVMGKTPKDRDYVVVGATPEQMLAKGFEQVGASFPVFLHPETRDEWALARVERKTGVGYQGFAVSTEDVTLEDDLARRDLTMNAMAVDVETGEMVDPFNGRADVEAKVLRHVSDAFAEDPLRVVRLARFYARYTDFSVALETFDLATKVVLSGEMDSLPDERFVTEFVKVFDDEASDFGRFVEMLHMLGVFQHVKFFKKTFTYKRLVDVRMMGDFVSDAKAAGVSTEDVMTAAFLATVTDAGALRGFGSDVRDAFSAAKLFMSVAQSTATAVQVMSVLKKVRSTRGLSKHAESALTVLAALSDRFVSNLFVDVTVWRDAATAAAAVDVDTFVTRFEGKELGEQLHAAMVAAVDTVLKG